MNIKSLLLSTLLLGTTGLLCVAPVNAQNPYPSRTIQTIMPLQAGGGVDLLMRPIAQKMGENLGQAITIENLPGGAGLIGAGKVAQSAPDGYVLGAFNDSILTMLPNLYKKVITTPSKALRRSLKWQLLPL